MSLLLVNPTYKVCSCRVIVHGIFANTTMVRVSAKILARILQIGVGSSRGFPYTPQSPIARI